MVLWVMLGVGSIYNSIAGINLYIQKKEELSNNDISFIFSILFNTYLVFEGLHLIFGIFCIVAVYLVLKNNKLGIIVLRRLCEIMFVGCIYVSVYYSYYEFYIYKNDLLNNLLASSISVIIVGLVLMKVRSEVKDLLPIE